MSEQARTQPTARCRALGAAGGRRPVIGRRVDRARCSTGRKRGVRSTQRGYEAGVAAGRQPKCRRASTELQARVQHLDSILDFMATPARGARRRGGAATGAAGPGRSGSTSCGASSGSTPTQIIAIIRDTVALLPVAARDVRVHLHPGGRRSWCASAWPRRPRERAWSIIEDPTLSRGGCLVQHGELTDRRAPRKPRHGRHCRRPGRRARRGAQRGRRRLKSRAMTRRDRDSARRDLARAVWRCTRRRVASIPPPAGRGLSHAHGGPDARGGRLPGRRRRPLRRAAPVTARVSRPKSSALPASGLSDAHRRHARTRTQRARGAAPACRHGACRTAAARPDRRWRRQAARRPGPARLRGPACA